MGVIIVYYDKGTGERYISTNMVGISRRVGLHVNTLLRKLEGGLDVYDGEGYLLLKFDDEDMIRGHQRFFGRG